MQQQTDQLRDWNRSLEDRVAAQLAELERTRRLERFLAPQVAQLIAASDGHDKLLDSHRREVTVVFCDLRGFTAFTEAADYFAREAESLLEMSGQSGFSDMLVVAANTARNFSEVMIRMSEDRR